MEQVTATPDPADASPAAAPTESTVDPGENAPRAPGAARELTQQGLTIGELVGLHGRPDAMSTIARIVLPSVQATAARHVVGIGASILADLQSPLAPYGRWHQDMVRSLVAPLQSAVVGSVALPRIWSPQLDLWSSTISASGWWEDLTLWPTDGWVSSLLSPTTVLRPHLGDIGRMMVELLDTSQWFGAMGTDLWETLRWVGARTAYWAVEDALAAMKRGDLRALEDFVRCWLDAAPTQHRTEGLVEALLQVDLAAYTPQDGHQLIDDLIVLVKTLTSRRRRDNESLLGMRRGHGPITGLGQDDRTVTHRLDQPRTVLLEDSVLDRIQPTVDPRLVELVNDLPRSHRKVAMIKIALGCSWTEAARRSGAPVGQGEVVRRRLSRHRIALPYTIDPWADTPPTSSSGGPFGILRSDAVVLDGAVGIYP